MNSKLIADQIRQDTSAKVVIDPTFLYDFSRCPLVKAPETDSDYIAVYGSEFAGEMIEGAVRYARENKLRIICLDSGGDKHSWCDEIITQDRMNPFDWCGYIRNSRALMTCTYHGLMFGLIYNKKIAFNATRFMLDKAEDFIDKLGLREILIDCKDFHSAMYYEWDYESLNRKFSGMKDEAFEFIRENITKGL